MSGFPDISVDDLFLVSADEPIYTTRTKICLPFPIAQSTPIIIHEMAHCVNYNSEVADHHGPNFCGVYLQIVKEFHSNAAYNELLCAFDKARVHYKIEVVK